MDEAFGSAIAVPAVVIEHAAPDRRVRRLLVGLADRRPHGDALGVGVLPVGVEDDLPRHLRDRLGVGGQHVAHTLSDVQWRGLCFLKLGVGDEPELVHAPEHVQLPGLGALGIGHRVVRGRGLRQAGQHGGFRDADVPQRATVIDLGGGREPIRPLPEEDLVDVQLEDFVLGEVGLDFPREQDLAQLSGDRLLPGQEEVAGDLHRDRARALLGAGGQIGQRRAGNGQVVDAAMLIETFIFRRQNGLFHHIRHFPDADHGTPLLPELAQKVAFRRYDPQRDLRLVVGQGLERRQRGPEQRKHERAQQGAQDREPRGHRREIEEPAS